MSSKGAIVMKRFLILTILGVLLISANSCIEANDIEDTSLLSDEYISSYNDDVLTLSESMINDELDYEMLISFIENGGIVVYEHLGGENLISEKMGMPLSVFPNASNESNKTIDVVTLYYTCGTIDGTHIISVNPETESDIDSLINETITSIKARQNEYDDSVVLTSLSPDDYEAVPLHILERTESDPPEGKLNVCYTLYSIENYSARDYYIIMVSCNGMPGCTLYKRYPTYDSKYQSEYLNFSISTDTPSVTVDAYGPHSSIESSSYTVDFSGSIDTDRVVGLSAGFSYTRNVESMTIDATAISKSVDWEVNLGTEAEESNVLFEPAITFDCPTGKASIVFDVICTYGVNSWNTLTYDIISDYSIRCTISSAEWY